MSENEVINEYFEWLYRFINGGNAEAVSYGRLFAYLYETPFIPHMKEDENRADDGVGLRYRFSLSYGLDDPREWSYRRSDYPTIYDGPCTMLELLISLAVRCEGIVSDPAIGDRTSQWFWGMVVNLGLGAMYDGNFDKEHAERCIERFHRNKYAPNGEGGLFKLRHCDYDLRYVDIWSQMCWYLNEVT